MAARSEVLESLGIEPAELEHEGHVVGTYIAAEATGRTELAGVYVAGNVADLQAQVMAAAAAGVKVAAAVNADLIEEEITAAVARHRG
jgi:thioredoxin reductase